MPAARTREILGAKPGWSVAPSDGRTSEGQTIRIALKLAREMCCEEHRCRGDVERGVVRSPAGPIGTGKTMLAMALGVEVSARCRRLS
jgi:hypothetical protein